MKAANRRLYGEFLVPQKDLVEFVWIVKTT